jgi:acetylglutamate kinase
LIRLGSRAFSAADGIPPHEIANGEFGQLPIQPVPSGPEPIDRTDTDEEIS